MRILNAYQHSFVNNGGNCYASHQWVEELCKLCCLTGTMIRVNGCFVWHFRLQIILITPAQWHSGKTKVSHSWVPGLKSHSRRKFEILFKMTPKIICLVFIWYFYVFCPFHINTLIIKYDMKILNIANKE